MGLAFGAWLIRRRRQLDLTQDDLAQSAHCSVNTIRKIEAGDLMPSVRLAQALELPTTSNAEFVQFARE
jgi:transcriptional regulator with XRE-family HTH domain